MRLLWIAQVVLTQHSHPPDHFLTMRREGPVANSSSALLSSAGITWNSKRYTFKSCESLTHVLSFVIVFCVSQTALSTFAWAVAGYLTYAASYHFFRSSS